MAARILQAVALAMMQVLTACASNSSDLANQAPLLRGTYDPYARGNLKWKGCSSLKAYSKDCQCVDSVYEDKCKGCMCGDGSTSWCNTACEATGDENACCQSFKPVDQSCDQNWECGPTNYGKKLGPYHGDKMCFASPVGPICKTREVFEKLEKGAAFGTAAAGAAAAAIGSIVTIVR